MDDLINAGVVGLIEAYGNFDTGKGVKFETYASLRIRGSILRRTARYGLGASFDACSVSRG